jgi:site-specific recombinase XerD
MRDFFSSHIRNANTRRAYLEAVRQFSAYCAGIGIVDLAQVEPIHVAAFVEAVASIAKWRLSFGDKTR